MPTLQLAARGPAPVDLVWGRYADPARWAEWSPQITAVRTPVVRIAAGVRGTVVGPGLGPVDGPGVGLLRVRVPFEVLAVDEAARTWSWRVRLGPATVELDHAVRVDGDLTLTTLALRGPVVAVPLLLGYAPVAQLALRRLVSP